MLALLSLLGIAFAGMALIPSLRGDPDTHDSPAPDEDELHLREPSELDLDTEWLFAGTDADDTLQAGPEDDVIGGRGGNDTLDGFDGNDTISGGADEDDLHGGRDDDLLFGGDGDDALYGHVDDDSMLGGMGNDTLNGGGGRDLLFGGDGDDTLQGSYGADTLVGGAGEDVMHGGVGHDVIDGRSGEITAALDYLNGGSGNDTLLGGAFDNLHGGPGSDIFALDATTIAASTIEDFDPVQDTIVVFYDGKAEAPDLTAEEDETGTTLLVDGAPVAWMSGVSGLDLSLVQLVAA